MEKSVVVGKDTATDTDVSISEAGRRLSTYIIGKPGTGKSALLERIAYQDMYNGDGFCFIDPHEVSAEQLLRLVPSTRANDVIFWNPTDKARPFGINPFFCADPDEIDSASSNFLAVLASLAEFSEIFKSAPVMKSILKYVAVTFMVNQGYTLAETPEFLTNPSYRQQFYPALSAEYSQVRTTWERFDRRPTREQRELVASSLNKVERFPIDRTMRTVFGQPTNSIDFRQAMDTGKIIIVKLSGSRIGPDNAAFIGAFVIWNIFQAALSRSDTPASMLRPFHLIADEFQTYMSTAFPRLIEECRKFAVDVTVAHQTRNQLDERSRAATLAVGNKIVFGVSARDAAELAREFDTTPPPAEAVPEQMMEPVYETYVDESVTGSELDAVRAELAEVEATLAVLRKSHATASFEQKLLDECFVVRGVSRDHTPGLVVFEDRFSAASYEHNPQYPYTPIYRSLNPNHANQAIEAQAHYYLYGDNWTSRVEGRCSFSFPTHVPTLAEERLEKKAQQETYYSTYLSDDECRAIVTRIQRDFLALFLPLKDKAMYWYDLHKNLEAVRTSSVYGKDSDEWPGGPRGGDAWELTEFPEVLEWLRRLWIPLSKLVWDSDIEIRTLEKRRTELTQQIQQLKTKKRLTHYRPIREVRGVGLSSSEVATRDAISAYRLKEGSRRSHDDVANEIANALTNLPARVAWCKLTENYSPVEYIISTIAPPEMPSDGVQRAQEIREQSRAVYGRERGAVEAQITQRLQTSAAAGENATMEGDGDNLPTDQPAPNLSDIFDSPDI